MDPQSNLTSLLREWLYPGDPSKHLMYLDSKKPSRQFQESCLDKVLDFRLRLMRTIGHVRKPWLTSPGVTQPLFGLPHIEVAYSPAYGLLGAGIVVFNLHSQGLAQALVHSRHSFSE